MSGQNEGGPRGNIVHARRLCETFGLTLRQAPYAYLGSFKVSLAFSSAITTQHGRYKYWFWSYQALLPEEHGPETDFVLLDGEESERHHYFLLGKAEIQRVRRLYKRKRPLEQLAVNIDNLFQRAGTWSDRSDHVRLILANCEKTEDELKAFFQSLPRPKVQEVPVTSLTNSVARRTHEGFDKKL